MMAKKMIFNTQTLIHHFLEESVRVYPEKVALIHEDIRITYWNTNQNNQSRKFGTLPDFPIYNI
jgi:hypothetical protein